MAGTIVPILTDYERPGRPVSVLRPANRHLPTKVREFVDSLVDTTQRETRPERLSPTNVKVGSGT